MLIRTDSLGPVGLGYFQIDDRASDGRHIEADTYTCTHCQRVVVMNPDRKRERYKCRGCDHHICDDCAALRAAGGACKTFKQLADEILTQVEKGSPIILP